MLDSGMIGKQMTVGGYAAVTTQGRRPSPEDLGDIIRRPQGLPASIT